MKIAILTLPLHTNYGGLLQAYALMKFLKKNNHEVTLINRDFNADNFRIGNLLYNLFIRKIISLKTNRFISRFIYPRTRKINSTPSFKLLKDLDMDLIIVGSDQVWRVEYVKGMYKDYFLSFVNGNNVKKISYAASFGTEIWNHSASITAEIRTLLNDFTAVSVREKSAVDICEEYFGIHAEQIMDPTFLLDKEDYLKIIYGYESKYEYNSNRSGLFSYILDPDVAKDEIIRQISNALNMDSFSVNVTEKFNIKKIYKIYKNIYPSVEEWLSGFNTCNYVITDSYHGVIFALIFNKPFIAIGNMERGIDRFISLLSMLKMTNRLIYTKDDLSNELISDKIDYTKINQIIMKFKYESKRFLLENIQ